MADPKSSDSSSPEYTDANTASMSLSLNQDGEYLNSEHKLGRVSGEWWAVWEQQVRRVGPPATVAIDIVADLAHVRDNRDSTGALMAALILITEHNAVPHHLVDRLFAVSRGRKRLRDVLVAVAARLPAQASDPARRSAQRHESRVVVAVASHERDGGAARQLSLGVRRDLVVVVKAALVVVVVPAPTGHAALLIAEAGLERVDVGFEPPVVDAVRAPLLEAFAEAIPDVLAGTWGGEAAAGGKGES